MFNFEWRFLSGSDAGETDQMNMHDKKREDPSLSYYKFVTICLTKVLSKS